MNYIASNLKFLRKLTGLSQEQFAKKVEMNRGNIASYEKGNAEPNIEKLQKIVAYFDVDLVTFIEMDLSEQINAQHISQRFASDPDRHRFGSRSVDSKMKNLSASLFGTKGGDKNFAAFSQEQLNNFPLESMSQVLGNIQKINEYDMLAKHKFYNDVHSISLNLERLTRAVETLVDVNKKLIHKKTALVN